ncbi:MAG: glutamate 5-kinase [Chromatocurvus sp.]
MNAARELPATRIALSSARRWVVKVGSALLTDDGRGLDTAMICSLAQQIVSLRSAGCEVVLVSSGAVSAGVVRLGWPRRPTVLHELQAAAAVGQSVLLQQYEQAFQRYGLTTAQILLGHDDVAARDRYLNARTTLTTLLRLNVLPVVNENDTVATEEIRFGDNDSLAALVANLIDADALLLLTDQDGLFDADPRLQPAASLLTEVDVHDSRLDGMVGDGGALGRGGMVTKLRAARLAARSGTQTVIAGGRLGGVMQAVARGERVGTWLRTGRQPQNARRQWLAGLLQLSGRLRLDDGAVRVIRKSGRSLLPVGVRDVEGDFRRGDVVACCDANGSEVARGMINYGAPEARLIAGRSSTDIPALLGYAGDEELIHRDNLVMADFHD